MNEGNHSRGGMANDEDGHALSTRMPNFVIFPLMMTIFFHEIASNDIGGSN